MVRGHVGRVKTSWRTAWSVGPMEGSNQAGAGNGPLEPMEGSNQAGRLQDILDSIQRIEERIGGGRQRFESDDMLQVWVVHHLQIIGEAVRSIS